MNRDFTNRKEKMRRIEMKARGKDAPKYQGIMGKLRKNKNIILAASLGAVWALANGVSVKSTYHTDCMVYKGYSINKEDNEESLVFFDPKTNAREYMVGNHKDFKIGNEYNLRVGIPTWNSIFPKKVIESKDCD